MFIHFKKIISLPRMNNKSDQRPFLKTQTIVIVRLRKKDRSPLSDFIDILRLVEIKLQSSIFFRQDFYIILSSLYSVLMMDFYHSYFNVRPDGFFSEVFFSEKVCTFFDVKSDFR